MNPMQRLALAAAQDLAQGLGAPPRPKERPRVSQTLMKPPDQAPTPTVDYSVLEALAREVVEAVLALSGQELNRERMAGILERAAQKHLLTHPQGAEALRVRLPAQIPRLLNLPRLAELAAGGLELHPAAPLAGAGGAPEIITGFSPAFARVLRDLELAAETDFPVLLLGETGTGKELMARRLHQLSPRARGPLVAVNCAAISQGLLESELFGHVKGAFTGADSPSRGYIRASDGGSLFLDEIAETSPEFQVRLLRVLEDRIVTPVGSHRGVRVDFRLIAASHLDLEQAAAEGRFNQSLLYRILVVPLKLPPLRQRREDIPALLDHFLSQACLLAKRTRTISPDARRMLAAYHWPGNVRQLGAVVQRLAALSPEYEIGVDQLPPEIRHNCPPGAVGDMMDLLSGIPGVPEKRVGDLARLLVSSRDRSITNQDVRQGLGCSDSTAGNLLRALSQAGVLEKTGRRGGRRYRVKKPKEE